MSKVYHIARNKDTFLHTLGRLLKYVFLSVICNVIDHKWGDWYKGEIGKNIWKEERECKRCHQLEGKGGFLPPKPWPDPPERNE